MNLMVSSDRFYSSDGSANRLLIGGEWVAASSGRTFETRNPADGSVIAAIAEGGQADIDQAVAAARTAFESGPWSRMPPSERADLLWRLADKIEQHIEEIALLETLDSGKLLRATRHFDVPKAIENLRYHAGWTTKINGETIPVGTPGSLLAYTQREPVGVVGQIVPWNSPLVMAVAKIAPALAAGCTTILKPAELTSLTALRLGEFIQEVGFPAGVVNIVTGYGPVAGAALAAHPRVDKIAFTGSTEVGKSIARAATGNMKRVTLELGGKSPVIVFPDADLTATVEGVFRSIFNNSGQFCAAGSRLYVHDAVATPLLERLAEKARAMKIGPGTDAASELGPLVSDTQQKRVLAYITAGCESGARLVTGGEHIDREGYFVTPTIFKQTPQRSTIMQEEIFGPVLCAQTFSDDTVDSIVEQANDSTYGLAAYIWTSNVSAALKTANKLRAGSIRINGGGAGLFVAIPYGGFKQSGWGREYGREGVEAYTELKSIMVAL